jgi:hypothetical protein
VRRSSVLAPLALLATAALTLSACGNESAGLGASAGAASGTAAVSALRAPASVLEPARAPGVPAVRNGRYAVGDSVMLGSKPLLSRTGFTVNATVSRQFGSGVSIIRRAATTGTLPRNVVVHLGTNGTISSKDCRAIVETAGPARRVFFVNVRVPRPWTPGNNKVLRACDAAFDPGRVQIIDWSAASAGHPRWFGPDNIHPSGSGRAAYTALIDSTVDRLGL